MKTEQLPIMYGISVTDMKELQQHRLLPISIKTRTYKVKLIVTDNQGASSSFTATIKVTSATGDNSKFNFEDGTLGGFTTSGTNATGVVVNTTEKAFKGERGLKWTVTSEGEGTAELKLDGGTIVVPGTTMTLESGYLPVRLLLPSSRILCLIHLIGRSPLEFDMERIHHGEDR